MHLFIFLLSNKQKMACIGKFPSKMYKGSPTYAVFTTADPTTAILGLMRFHKLGKHVFKHFLTTYLGPLYVVRQIFFGS